VTSRADSANSVMLIEEYAARLANSHVSKQLHALFLIKHEIYSILQKTKDPAMAVIRLKWWYEEVAKSRNNGFATLNMEFEIIQNYLKEVSEENLLDIANWIASYEPMVSRGYLTDLLEDYIVPVSDTYQKVLKEIYHCNISSKLALMISINDFLDYMPFFFKFGWYWAQDEADFNNQLKLVWERFDVVSKRENGITIDKKVKFLYQAHECLISKYRKYEKWELSCLPKLNLGLMRMSLAFIALNK